MQPICLGDVRLRGGDLFHSREDLAQVLGDGGAGRVFEAFFEGLLKGVCGLARE